MLSTSSLSRHGYSGEYLASTFSVDVLSAARSMTLFSLTDRKLPRSVLAPVTVPYSVLRLACSATSVLLVVVISDSAFNNCGAAWS